MSNQSDQRIIAQTKEWVTTVIVAHNYCPFAKREMDKDSIKYQVVHETEFNALLDAVLKECAWLDHHTETETTLVIFPENLSDFNLFLDCLALVEDTLVSHGYEGIYQVASFHPDYYFQGAEISDPANYTNRSPYPMLHLIREASVEIATRNHPDPESIPERNIEYARKQGLDKMKEALNECMKIEK